MKRRLLTIDRLREGARMALDAIRANKGRAALTILGVAIGVMVVIGMASVITGINGSVATMLESAGPRTFFVFRYFRGGFDVSDGSDEMSPWRRNPPLTVADAELIRDIPGIRGVTIQEGTQGPVAYNGVDLKGIRIAGLSANWPQVTGGDIIAGRSYTEAEYTAGARVVVINDKLAEQLFPNLEPIGKQITIFGQPFTVIGLHVEASSLFGDGGEPRLAMPHTVFTRVADYQKNWMELSVMVGPEITIPEALERVTVALRVKRGLRPAQENNFSLVTQDKIMQSFDDMTQGFFLVMLALSSVGLMVGGVGVVAIMMISVTERTREIGVRKALGATPKEILFQFLVEAATLTLVGGLVGMALGGMIAGGLRAFTPIPAAVPLWSVVTAIIASIITGVGFGLYPARRAARLDPVEALRYE